MIELRIENPEAFELNGSGSKDASVVSEEPVSSDSGGIEVNPSTNGSQWKRIRFMTIVEVLEQRSR